MPRLSEAVSAYIVHACLINRLLQTDNEYQVNKTGAVSQNMLPTNFKRKYFWNVLISGLIVCVLHIYTLCKLLVRSFSLIAYKKWTASQSCCNIICRQTNSRPISNTTVTTIHPLTNFVFVGGGI